MATVEGHGSAPGEYPVVVVGSGPGGLQVSYFLTRLGIDHAVISADEGPAGMFRRFPLFDRLISWTKPEAPVRPGSREYQWYDWNSLLVEDPDEWVGVASFMDETSIFPSRAEMEASLVAFADRVGITARYGCRWLSTRRTDDGWFVLETTEGEYRCRVPVFASGVSAPYKPPDIPGIEHVPHYMEVGPPDDYKGKSLFILGKAISAFEVATGLLSSVRSVVLASPHEVRLTALERSFGGLRARYMQPYEDFALEGRTVSLLNASTERFERTASGFRIYLRGSDRVWDLVLDVDEAIAATGVSANLGDLPLLGVATVRRGGVLPALTPFWESPTVPGVYFAGSTSQGSFGLHGYGVGAVHGFRFCARILAGHIAEQHFGIERARPRLAADEVVPYLLREVTFAPELWHQRGVLGRVITFDPAQGIVDEGILPLAHFVDEAGPDGVAAGVVSQDEGALQPVFYLRRGGDVEEHILDPTVEVDFRTPEHAEALSGLLGSLLS
ncbi:MAG: NAD(P)-binding domain-containing protein [Actinomycetota bacterium]